MAQTKAKTVADVIAGALKVLGPNGENWNNRTLHMPHPKDGHDTYCALGAIGKAAHGADNYYGRGVEKEAANLVASCAPKHYFSSYNNYDGGDIPDWNDSLPAGKQGFRSIKSVFCKALKKAIAQEQPAKRKAVAKKRKKRA